MGQNDALLWRFQPKGIYCVKVNICIMGQNDALLWRFQPKGTYIGRESR